jgi:hypothetical protein
MPFTLSVAQTIAGIANSYEVTGSGNLDELVTACASIGMSRTNNAIVFAPNADRILCVSGTLTDTREGDRTVLIRSQGHICWAYAATSSVTLGLLNTALGVYTGAVHVVYEPTALTLGGGSQFANAALFGRCIIGSGNFIGTSGSFFANQAGASHFDYADNLVGVHLDSWRIFNNGVPHVYKSGGRTTTTKTLYTVCLAPTWWRPAVLSRPSRQCTSRPAKASAGLVRLLGPRCVLRNRHTLRLTST